METSLALVGTLAAVAVGCLLLIRRRRGGKRRTVCAAALRRADRLRRKQRYAKALGWYRRAAKAGDAEAIYVLACACLTGEGGETSLSEAFHWASVGLAAGDERCKPLCREYARLLADE